METTPQNIINLKLLFSLSVTKKTVRSFACYYRVLKKAAVISVEYPHLQVMSVIKCH